MRLCTKEIIQIYNCLLKIYRFKINDLTDAIYGENRTTLNMPSVANILQERNDLVKICTVANFLPYVHDLLQTCPNKCCLSTPIKNSDYKDCCNYHEICIVGYQN